MAYSGKLGTSLSWFSNIELGASIAEVSVTSTLSGESTFSALNLLSNLSVTLPGESTASATKLLSCLNSTIPGTSTLAADLFSTLSSLIPGTSDVVSNLGLSSPVTVTFSGESQLNPSLSSIYELYHDFSGESQVIADLGYSLQLLDAQAINPNTIVLRFSAYPDLTAAATRDVSHYVIDQLIGDPNPISVVRVVEDPDPKSLRLITSKQVYTLYRVTVDIDIISIYGSPGSPDHNSLTFTGFPEVGRQKNQAVSLSRILINFNQVMSSSGLTDPSNYLIQDESGSTVSVSSVSPNVVSSPTKVSLQLSTPLGPSNHYSVTISSTILSNLGLDILPPSTRVGWFSKQNLVRVPLSRFTGEVQTTVEVLTQSNFEQLQLEESLVVSHTPYQVRPEYPEGYLAESHEITEELSVVSSGSSEVTHSVSLVDSILLSEGLSPSRSVSIEPVSLSLVEVHSIQESLSVTPLFGSQDLVPANSTLVGASRGLVFFSPSLASGSPDSSLKIDSVTATTQAKDTYLIPQPTSIPALVLWGSSGTTLNNSGCLDMGLLNSGKVSWEFSTSYADIVSSPTEDTPVFTLTPI